MKPIYDRFVHIAFICLLVLVGCAQTPTPPPIDTIGTIAAQMASVMLTQTVAAYSPTPLPATDTLVPTETATPEPSKDPSKKIVTVVGRAPCYFGPGSTYALESYISNTKKVELVGVGSVSGWYVIMNPYFHQACWIEVEHIRVDDDMDLTLFPTITP